MRGPAVDPQLRHCSSAAAPSRSRQRAAMERTSLHLVDQLVRLSVPAEAEQHRTGVRIAPLCPRHLVSLPHSSVGDNTPAAARRQSLTSILVNTFSASSNRCGPPLINASIASKQSASCRLTVGASRRDVPFLQDKKAIRGRPARAAKAHWWLQSEDHDTCVCVCV